MHILDNIRSCVARKYHVKRTPTRVYFRVKIADAFKSEDVPSQLKSLLVYIAREGVSVTDLFRRPGNPQDMKRIISDLENGVNIDWKTYNFYTLANISKRFLLSINGGLLGPEAEEALIKSLDSPDDQTRIEAMHNVIISQPKKVQRLMALLFGIWFRMIYHTEVNAMSVEAVAKSVAGSVFPSTCASLEKVEKASKVMEYLITGFASADLFGKELIEYFTNETKTSISRVEKFKYEFLFPIDVPREKSTRLFMRMLVAEAKKHGFDVIKNVVSKEAFEASNWNYALTNEMTEPCENDREQTPFDSYKPVSSSENYGKENVPPPSRPAKPIKLGQGPSDLITTRSQNFRQEEISSPDSSFIQTMTTMTSATLTPKLARHASFTKSKNNLAAAALNRSASIKESLQNNGKRPSNMVSRNTSSSSRINPVQQFCEKRTCVTASAQEKYDSDHCMNRAERMKNNYSQGLPTSVSEHGCFNIVKERQLERLQKRSDWFLSPPTGVRSSILMQIDPGCLNINDHHQPSPTSLPASRIQQNYQTPSRLPNASPDCSIGDDDEDFGGLTKFPASSLLEDPNNTFYENNRHIEVRYFVVERYYGPEPRPNAVWVNEDEIED